MTALLIATLGRVLCALGLHDWEYYRFKDSANDYRACRRCPRIEWDWTPRWIRFRGPR